MPKFCPTCGAELRYQEAEICPSCGVRIKEQPLRGQSKIRNPGLAIIFSFFCPGWGQWYNGRTWDGLQLFGAFAAIYIVMGIFSFTAFAIVLDLALIVIWLYGMYDAFRMADRVNRKELGYNGVSILFWLPVALIVIIVAAVIAAFVMGMAGNAYYS